MKCLCTTFILCVLNVCDLCSDEKDGCQLSNDCFTMCVVLILSNLIEHASLKCHVKTDTNMIDSFCSNSETKNITPFFTHNGIEA